MLHHKTITHFAIKLFEANQFRVLEIIFLFVSSIVSADPLRILDAYLEARYVGGVTDLLEPDNGQALLPRVVDNARFPQNFAVCVGSCDK